MVKLFQLERGYWEYWQYSDIFEFYEQFPRPVGVLEQSSKSCQIKPLLTRTMKQFYQSKNISHFNTFNFAICIERNILQRQQVKPCLRSPNELIITPREADCD